ncbi:unnamed protein product [Musa acuminata var. zebrina]
MPSVQRSCLICLAHRDPRLLQAPIALRNLQEVRRVDPFSSLPILSQDHTD